ncbi:MAG TPA: hypothetical protein PKY30_17365, partial [Myxococcota bacterium]|nr:hypothetical protein [Myxococcota bacterium]
LGDLLWGGTLLILVSGFLEDGADATGAVFAGIAADSVDNTDGDDGAETLKVYTSGQFLLTGSGFAAGDEGKPVYIVDNQTVSLASSSLDYFVKVGRIMEVVSSSQVWVELDVQERADIRQFTVRVAGVNAAALNLASLAAPFGGAGFYVTAVQAMESFVTATRASDGLRNVTTHYTVADGVITLVSNESSNTLIVTFTGHLL